MANNYILKAGVSLLVLVAAAPVSAQAGPDQRESESSLSDIIVTANRREQTVLKVPISVTAYSQESLDLKGIRNIEAITRMTPGVSLNQGSFGIKYLVIRGLTSSVGATMNGVYLDDTPVQVRSISLATNFYPGIFDLERVEVLRGPQGTSFGGGAMGGAIRFISAQPSVEKYSAYGRAELATTEEGSPSYEAGAAVGGPIVTDKIGFRVSAYYRRDGGWIDRVPFEANRGTPKEDANSGRRFVGQAALTIKPTENLTITPGLFFQQANSYESDQYWTTRPGAATPLTTTPYPALTSGEGGAAFNRDRAIVYSIKAQLDLGSATLINNTAFTDRKVVSESDGTGFFLDFLGQPQTGGFFASVLGVDFRSNIALRQAQRSFTQELRLQSNGDGPVNYYVGLFYQNSRQRVAEFDTSTNPFGIANADGSIPILPSVNGLIGYALDRVRDRQIAGFAQVDYKIFDRMTLTAGLRYSRTTVDYTNTNGYNLPSDQVGGGSSKDHPLTPKFGAEFQLTDKMMIYASAAKGFRPGGSNPVSSVIDCSGSLAALGLSAIPRTYRSDSVWSYEIGAKGSPNQFLSFAADVFQLNWKNVQRTRNLPTCAQNFIENFGAARARGVEAKIIITPLRGFSIDTNLSYTDARQRQTLPNFALQPDGSLVRSGNLVTKGDRFAAPWIISVAADYETNLGTGETSAYGHLQWDYRSGYSAPSGNAGFIPLLGRVFTQEFVSARVGIRHQRTDFSLFVDNLLDSKDELGRLVLGAGGANRLLRQSYRPRTVGITASHRL
jgi:outer membrane receptor protein involved in Fe transport